MTQYETFETWLNKYLILDISPEIKAVNFNLYESSCEEDEFDIQLIGANKYDHDDPDWACAAIFSTGEDLVHHKSSRLGRLLEACYGIHSKILIGWDICK